MCPTRNYTAKLGSPQPPHYPISITIGIYIISEQIGTSVFCLFVLICFLVNNSSKKKKKSQQEATRCLKCYESLIWYRPRSFVWHWDWFILKIFNKCLLGIMLIMSFKLLCGQLEKATIYSPRATFLIHGPTAQGLLEMWSSRWVASMNVLPQVTVQMWPSLTAVVTSQLAMLHGLLNEKGKFTLSSLWKSL